MGCETDPTVAVSGRMISWPEGTPVAGVTVQMARQGIASGTLASATSDGDGFFTLQASADDGATTVALQFTPPAPLAPFRIDSLTLQASTTRGEGYDLGRLAANPYSVVVGEVRDRRRGMQVVPYAVARFDPYGDTSQRITATADPYGRFVLIGGTGVPDGVRGRLYLASPDGQVSRTINDYYMPPRYRDEALDLSGFFGIGPVFRHYINFFLRTGARFLPPPEGTRVEFVRRSGVNISPSRLEARTTSWGAISFLAVPSAKGVVTGDLIVHLKPPLRPDTLRDFRLPTTEDDNPELYGSVGVGPSLSYILVYRPRGESKELPLDQIRAEFVRATDGSSVPVSLVNPDDPQPSLTDWGGVHTGLLPLDDGVFKGTLRLHFPGDLPPLDAPIELETFRSDSTRALEVKTGPSVNYALQFYLRSAGRQIDAAETQVRFERSGGVAAFPESVTRTTTSWGAITLATLVTQPGELRGDFIVTLPPPRTGADTIRDVRIPTFDDESHRFLGRFGVGGQINYAVGIFDNDTEIGLPDTNVRFERTGGIEVRPAVFEAQTTSWGAFALQLETDEEGEVIGDLVIELESGDVRISGIRVPTFRTDEFRLLGWFGV